MPTYIEEGQKGAYWGEERCAVWLSRAADLTHLPFSTLPMNSLPGADCAVSVFAAKSTRFDGGYGKI
jgi:hypothetical protein